MRPGIDRQKRAAISFSRIVLSLFVILLPVTLSSPALSMPEKNAPSATVEPAQVPARGRGEAILTVSRAGRFAVTVKSPQGTALQIVDQMAGPGAMAGRAGEEDGRLDALFDLSRYKVRTFAHKEGSGEAALAVHPFRELNSPEAPVLVELKPVAASLGDFEQRSYWLDLTSRRHVILEAAGRNLSDLRLWKEGGWLVDAAPVKALLEPLAGKPLRVFRLAVDLPPGLYLLTAYGGPPEPWAEEDEAHPFHLRFGIPRLPTAGRRHFTVGPFGLDRWLVPARASYYRLELPESVPAAMRVETFAESQPFQEGGDRAEITKKSRLPVAELTVGSGQQGFDLVTVSGAEGQPYVLQHFFKSVSYRFHESGRYWVSSIHTGHPRDSVDATAIVERTPRPVGHYRPFLAQTVVVGPKRGWARRCNLLADLTVFVRIAETGDYEILAKGTEAEFRFVPFFITPPRDYRPPKFRRGDSTWSLDAGYYILTARPVSKGILEVGVRHKVFMDNLWDLLKAEKVKERPVRPAVQFPSVQLEYKHSYTMFLNEQPGVHTGIVVRRLPVDLSDALPIVLLPSEGIEVSVYVPGDGYVQVKGEDGEPLEISLDGGPWVKRADVGPGGYALRVRHGGEETVIASAGYSPAALEPEAPMPAIAAGRLAALPEFPLLTEEAPAFFDLPREGETTYLVRTGEPAFFRLESTGLLATEGTVRTRVIPALARDSGGGTGRNFFVGRYLRQGEYQLTVRARGRSTGHLGLHLARAPVRDGGVLHQGLAARATLSPGEGIRYEFTIEEEGAYRLESMGLGRSFPGRLEDGEGWPLVKPGTPVNYPRRHFFPGRYRLFLPPGNVASRRVTLLDRVPQPPEFEGHGPHPLALDQHVSHLWRESQEDEERKPDRWDFRLPAKAEVDIALGVEMEGDLLRREGERYIPAAKVSARNIRHELDEGEYRLEAVCARRNDRVRYTLAVRPRSLVAGGSRQVRAPASLDLAVGSGRFIEILSRGREDVRARLFNEKGTPVAASDDRLHDWNFQIVENLDPGPYRLELAPVGAAGAATEVLLRSLDAREEAPLGLPATREFTTGKGISLIPLAAPDDEGVLLISAAARGTLGMALEHRAEAAWKSLGETAGESIRLFLPLGEKREAGETFRLRLWSADRIPREVRLLLRQFRPAAVDEGGNVTGNLEPVAVPDFSPALTLGEVALARPGFFRVLGGDNLWWSPGERRPLRPVGEDLLFGLAACLWLAADPDGEGRPPVLSLQRFFLPLGEPVLLPLADVPVRCDLAGEEEGPLLVVARTQAGRPGLRLLAGLGSPDEGSAAAGMAVAPRAAAALLPGGGFAAALVWDAAGAGRAKDVHLRQWRFSPPPREEISPGLTEGELPAGESRAFLLPKGWKRVRVALSRRLAGAFSREDEIVHLAWGDGAATDDTLETDSSTLTLVNPEGPAGRFSLELVPLEKKGRVLRLSPEDHYEALHDRSGSLRLVLDGGRGKEGEQAENPARLRVAGAVEEAIFVGEGGQVRRGVEILLPADRGTVILRHRPGLVFAWIEREEGETPSLWRDGKPRRTHKVKTPEAISLEGEALALQFPFSEATALHLRTDAAVVSRLLREGEPPQVRIHPEGGRIDLPVEAGSVEIWLRPAGELTLHGEARLTASPVIFTGEGLGPEVLLAPGQTRVFSFRVDREGPVGFGVRAEADVVRALLIDERGRRLAGGVIGMETVTPGTYYLALEAPRRGRPVWARPALAGIVPPGEGPPDEIVKQYLKMAARRPNE